MSTPWPQVSEPGLHMQVNLLTDSAHPHCHPPTAAGCPPCPSFAPSTLAGRQSVLPPHVCTPHSLSPLGCFHRVAGGGHVHPHPLLIDHRCGEMSRVSQWAVDTLTSTFGPGPKKAVGCTATGFPLRGWIQPCWHLAAVLRGHTGGDFPSSLHMGKGLGCPQPSPDLMWVMPRGCSPHTRSAPGRTACSSHVLLRVMAGSSACRLPHPRQSVAWVCSL